MMSKYFLFFFFSFKFYSQTVDTIYVQKVEELWEVALLSNSSIKIYELEHEQTQLDYKVSRSNKFPQIGAAFSGQYNNDIASTPVPGELVGIPGETAYLQFGKKVSFNSGITINKSLFDWQQKFQSKKIKETINLVDAQKESYYQTLKIKIAKYYYSLLIAKSAIEIAKRDEEIASEILSLNQLKFNNGLISEITLNQFIINYNNIVNNKSNSIELYNESHFNLIQLLGVNPTSIIFSSEKSDISTDIINSDIDFGKDKTLEVYKSLLKIEEFQIKSLKANFYPKINISRYIGFQQFQDNLQINFDNQDWLKNSYTNLSITIPVFTGFSNKNKLKSAYIEKEIKEAEFKNEVEQSLLRDKKIIESYKNLRNIVETSYSNYKLFEKNLNLNLQKMDNGLISQDIYLKNFEDYLAAENVYLNNLSNLLLIHAEIIGRK